MDLLKSFSNARYKESGFGCRCCGYMPYIIAGEIDTMCGFCEAYVSMAKLDVKALHPEMDTLLDSLHGLMKNGDWEGAVALAEQIKAGDDPYLLYGLGVMYRALSDAVYSHVDYSAKGFMEGNAAKRNNEPSLNKNNSMQLLSRSKEMLYRSLKIMGTKADDPELLYLSFLANMKLGMHVGAKAALDRLNGTGNERMRLYANTKYSVECKTRDSKGYLAALAKGLSPNSAYYVALDLARMKRFRESKGMLGILLRSAAMPEGRELLRRIYGAETASGL
ncbi:MAG: hypothetical protein KGH69_01820 [Candidatus Micrarchaeota archaeon]|nr:hypothetical protein [Candidatus Micrarchaeota archaeon]